MPDPFPLDRERELFYEGISHFNSQRFFEAHESWEEVWKNVYGHHKLFYQGLIQCAVSLEHLKRGNIRGAKSLLRNCNKRFAPLPRQYMGVEIWSLIESISRAMSTHPDLSATPMANLVDPAWPIIDLSCDPFASGEAEQRRRQA